MLLRQWSVHRQFVFPCSLTSSLTPGCILDVLGVPIRYYMCPILLVAYLTKFTTTSSMNPLLGHRSTKSMAHPSITTSSPIPTEGLVTATCSYRLMMDFGVEILRSLLFSSKREVGTAASSHFNMTFTAVIALVLINAVTLANINPESCCSIGSTHRFFLPSFVVITFLLIVW